MLSFLVGYHLDMKECTTEHSALITSYEKVPAPRCLARLMTTAAVYQALEHDVMHSNVLASF